VIRGTQRFTKGARKRDIVEPGEFILGYRNNQGYYPPTATVRAESDWKRHLPIVLAEVPSRFPSFDGGNAAARDFGRNGSFLVIRQLQQNVEGFQNFVEAKASRLREEYEPEKDGKTETGLLFTCLCADLDRQYEFVQQTWIQSPSFHGLKDEPDPMVAWPDPDKPRVFTIPTPTGPVTIRDMESFVTVRAGGYFFPPSRSAIQHLVDINQRKPGP
jgi:deferrochelatase/peroxidase EfeB